MSNWAEPQDEPTPEQQKRLKYYVPTRAEIERMKRLIREENGDLEPRDEYREPDWENLRHVLQCDVEDDE